MCEMNTHESMMQRARDFESAMLLAAATKADKKNVQPFVPPYLQPRKWNFEDLVMEAAAHDNYRSFISKQFTK